MSAAFQVLRGVSILAGFAVIVLLVRTFFLVPEHQSETTRSGPPDVILILIDALRRDHVGAYGYDRPTTPTIDRLAAGGIVFEDAWSQGSETYPSTSTMLTSRWFPLDLPSYAYQGIPGGPERLNEVFRQSPRLAKANVTLAEAFQDAGYDTIAALTNPHHHPTSGFDQGFETAEFIVNEDGVYAATRGDSLNSWFLGQIRQTDSKRPLFAYLHYMDVHNPYRPLPHVAREFVRTRGIDRYVNGIPERGKEPSPEDLAFMKESYDGEIRYTDELVGEILDGLEEYRPGRARVVVVASDHGDEFMDHGGLGHGITLEPEMLHVPLILHAPGLCKPARYSRLVRNLDIAPTLLDLVGIPVPPAFEGHNLADLACGTAAETKIDARLRDFAYASTGPWRSMTTPRWHFMWNRSKKRYRLYHRLLDPTGQKDVAPEKPGLVERFRFRLFGFEKRRQESRVESQRIAKEEIDPVKLDVETVERLKQLGYLDTHQE